MAAASDVDASEVQASTGITPETLKATLENKLQAMHVDIQDMSGKLYTIIVFRWYMTYLHAIM